MQSAVPVLNVREHGEAAAAAARLEVEVLRHARGGKAGERGYVGPRAWEWGYAGTRRQLPSPSQGLTLVPISAQLELTLPLSAQLKLALSPIYPNLTRGCVPKVLKLSCDVSDVSRRSSS